MKSAKFIALLFIFLGFFIFVKSASAVTSEFRSAATITTDGNPAYTNIQNCSVTDGNTCDRVVTPSSFANLYFKDFGNFNIPDGSVITNLRIRVKGRANIGMFVGVSLKNISGLYVANCQSPSDLWTMSVLNSLNLTTYTVTTPMTNGTLANCLSLANIKGEKFIFRINYSGPQNWFANIDNFEIAFDYTPQVVPTPTPTLTPTPTPTGPAPFLDLPWDYESKGETFSDAALSINSYFDHEYPLLSSGLREANSSANTIISSDGITYTKEQRSYSSHDGYDYGKSAKVQIGDSVLAAAAGTATYINSCGACGNMIVIDHDNGYQTRYLHMQKDGLVTNIPNNPVHVSARQVIGKVGATGNVQPAGDAGAHIHFGVFQDKNHDGNFGDNVPDGVTDPFGWQSNFPDPWENYSFFYNGMQRTGNKSYYLWKKNLDGMTTIVAASSGGAFTSGDYKVDLAQNSFNPASAVFQMQAEAMQKIGDTITSLIPTVGITLKNSLGDFITSLNQPMGITVDFSDVDTTRYNLGTISIYSSSDGVTWTKEYTSVDFGNEKATTNVSHLTHFALMGERVDIAAPITTAILSGNKGEGDWYNSDAVTTLSAQDNEGGLGVDYTQYKKDDNDWDNYLSPINISSEGHHEFEFYSADQDANIEDVKSVEFDIDKTPPVITHTITSDGQSYTPGIWTNKDVTVTFSCTDSLSGVSSFTDPITISNEGEDQTVSGQCQDKAGNVSADNVTGINIDKTSPEISISADPSIIWSPNGKLVPVVVTGSVSELNLANKTFTIIDEYGESTPVLSNFGDTIFLQALRNENDYDGRHYKIKVEASDKAGNVTVAKTEVLVPHDQSKK